MDAWYTTTLDIEESLCGAVDAHVHVFAADVVNYWILLIEGLWTGPSGLVCPACVWTCLF